jgi:hypothetical protein
VDELEKIPEKLMEFQGISKRHWQDRTRRRVYHVGSLGNVTDDLMLGQTEQRGTKWQNDAWFEISSHFDGFHRFPNGSGAYRVQAIRVQP